MNGRGFATGLLIGVIVGAVGGLLLTPNSGKENRQWMVDKYNRMRERIREMRQKGMSEEQAEAEAKAEFSGND